MRIAIVVDYSLDLIGGAQRAALNEATALLQAGHHVLVVGPRPARSLEVAGASVLWTDGRRLPALDFPLVADDAALRDRLRARFRAERIDAVHLHSEFGHAAAARAAAARLGLPVAHTVHTAYWPAVPAPLAPAARGLLARLAGPVPRRTPNPLLDHTLAAAAAADAVVSPSAHQAADLARLGGPVDLVLLNCDPTPAEPVPLPDVDHLRVAWIGRCVPEKRLTTFVRGVALAQRRLPAGRLRVAIAGAGLSLPAARLLATSVPGLVLLGRLDRTAVRTLLDASHLSALTSLGFDNQPMTIVESVRAGRGVLHTDPRLTEGLDRAGLLVAEPSARGIADLLVELALDPARVRRAADGARTTARMFSAEAHLAGLLPLLAGRPALAA
ncbi:glycosyltransferase family 4 protein [Amnibacterium endophyticum]|uniref:Glycosyltransferase family 4 protein n=1 Tax=Amnibacterium endophyticum TaxID=2109337 RepID=A0ABW4LG01_9MICO